MRHIVLLLGFVSISAAVCVDDAYLEGCPAYRLAGIGFPIEDKNRSFSFRAERVSNVTIRLPRRKFTNPAEIKWFQIKAWKKESKFCAAVPGLSEEECHEDQSSIVVESDSPLWFKMDCVNASHSCRFHRLHYVRLRPGASDGVVVLKPGEQTREFFVAVFRLHSKRWSQSKRLPLKPTSITIGPRSHYNITVRRDHGGIPCGVYSLQLNLNITCENDLDDGDYLLIGSQVNNTNWTPSYFDLSALSNEDVPQDATTATNILCESPRVEVALLIFFAVGFMTSIIIILMFLWKMKKMKSGRRLDALQDVSQPLSALPPSSSCSSNIAPGSNNHPAPRAPVPCHRMGNPASSVTSCNDDGLRVEHEYCYIDLNVLKDQLAREAEGQKQDADEVMRAGSPSSLDSENF
ncbi:uncharacterized protein LOC122248955 [Penaeus japonicus]|uniref:uncharacterized protein LOC122248955 n=1 Tax=Penaeus japonicus TaxID=27405 RepID=UPI001C712616|nr:uncharacterized protein LOC122248955 [Penaeus japonicus]